MKRFMYTTYCSVAFVVLALTALSVNLLLPNIRRRRQVARALSRAFLSVCRIPFKVHGLELLPATPCVVVANHASYIDAIVAVAALPPDFAFVIKREMVKVPLAGLLLRRLGSEFVERSDRHRGAADVRRVLRLATAGQSLMFFPEGTFDEKRQIGRFLNGAFATAARSGMPVVAAALRGTRELFPPGQAFMYRVPVQVDILGVLPAEEARLRSREMIAAAVGEPLAP